MKKLLLLFLGAVFSVMSSVAENQSYEWTCTKNDPSSQKNAAFTLTLNSVTWNITHECQKGNQNSSRDGNTPVSYSFGGKAAPVKEVTFSASKPFAGKKIISATVEARRNNAVNITAAVKINGDQIGETKNLTKDNTPYEFSINEVLDETGSITFDFISEDAGSSNSTLYVHAIKIVYTNADVDPAKVVSSVKIAPESCEFEGEQAVTLTAYNAESSEIEGAEILYSLNDGEETTGTSPVTFTLTETTTVKAWAKNVEPVEATFTKKIPEVKPDKPVVTVNGEVKEGDFEIVEGTAITISSNNALSLKDNGTDETYPNPYTFLPAVGEDIYEFVGINGKETSEPAMFAVTVKAPVRIARSATYDFTVDKAYGLDTQTGTSGTYETVIKSIPVGSASLSFADGAKYRHWAKNDGSYELRIIKNGGSFEISVSDDCYITSISFTGNIYLSTSTANVSENNKSYKCTGTDVKTVVFNSSANDRNDIHTITVKYMKSIDPANQPVAPTLNHNVAAKTIEISHEDAECSYEYRYEVVDDTPAIQAYATETENWTPVKGNSIEIPAASHPITSGNEKLNFYVRAVKNDIHGEATPILGISNDGIPSGITDIEAEENGVVEYFNLQGVRVAEPANGLYLRRSGNKVEKVVIR